MGVQPDQTLPAAGPATPSRKRKLESVTPAPIARSSLSTFPKAYMSGSASDPVLASPAKLVKSARQAVPKDPDAEKRLRRFRPKAPQSFDDVYERATSQRFYVLNRTRCGTDECPEEMIQLTGSTGNIYCVCIAKQPSCDCPHAKAGNQCKHWLYVMSRVLRAKHDYVYQLALLSTELQEIFANAPPPLDEVAADGESSAHDKNRKPVEGDCPICFEELEDKGEAIVWCRAACGQNIHKECFEMWAATKRQNGLGSKAEVTCPYCRSVWEGDEDMVKKIKTTGKLNSEGYVNVADQLGISNVRDTSSYSYWGRRRGQYL